MESNRLMSTNQKDTYFVAVKMFLEHDGKLFIFKDKFGDWDLPGGRIKPNEFDVPLEDIIQRKMNEEIGADVQYEIGAPIVFMRHERIEATEGNPTVRIFAVGYEAKLISGVISLSPQHTEMQWVDIHTFKPEDFFSGGWRKGVQEYLHIKRSSK